MSDVELLVDHVAEALRWVEPEPVFVGGATMGLFLDDFGRSQLRPTKDVDCIVPHVLSRTTWWKLEEALRARGWSPDPEGPLCRYRSPAGALVDLMSTDPAVQGFSSRWYPQVVATAERRSLVTKRAVLVPTPALLLACKLEAWESRGKSDPYTSKDLEDIAALLDGCRELEHNISEATADVRAWIASALARVSSGTSSREALVGQLPRAGDPDTQERRVLSLLSRLSRG